MPKKQRTDSTKGIVNSMKNAAMPDIEPPPHLHLREGDKPFWSAIVQTRARDRWTAPDLELAAGLARAKADIERLQIEIDAEGDIIFNEKGTPIENPKHRLLETLTRRSISLTKSLQLHAEATQGKSREQVKANKAQADAKKTLEGIEAQGLIARPH